MWGGGGGVGGVIVTSSSSECSQRCYFFFRNYKALYSAIFNSVYYAHHEICTRKAQSRKLVYVTQMAYRGFLEIKLRGTWIQTIELRLLTHSRSQNLREKKHQPLQFPVFLQ